VTTTKDVLEHHLKCFGERNLAGLLTDYASDAVLFTPYGMLKGTNAMKPLFEQVFAEFAKPGASFNITVQAIDGDYAYMLWTAETADNVYVMATDTYVVRGGKILVQSFAAHLSPKASPATVA
jgi:ketosteroid isomerase-like protein